MSYVTQGQIETAIPPQHLVDATDDDGDGVADAGKLTAIIAQADQQVDGFLAALYDVPFASPAPAAVREASFVFACELVYARRPAVFPENPFAKRANDWRERLGKIGAGDLPLDAAFPPAFSPGDAVTETAIIDGSTR